MRDSPPFRPRSTALSSLLTTVGYSDIAPRTVVGQILAAALMITGYALIANPTGIVAVELVGAQRQTVRGLARICKTPTPIRLGPAECRLL